MFHYLISKRNLCRWPDINFLNPQHLFFLILFGQLKCLVHQSLLNALRFKILKARGRIVQVLIKMSCDNFHENTRFLPNLIIFLKVSRTISIMINSCEGEQTHAKSQHIIPNRKLSDVFYSCHANLHDGSLNHYELF